MKVLITLNYWFSTPYVVQVKVWTTEHRFILSTLKAEEKRRKINSHPQSFGPTHHSLIHEYVSSSSHNLLNIHHNSCGEIVHGIMGEIP